MLRIRKVNEIRSVEDWFALAPPKLGIRQWADGRSAKELAKAWFPVPGDPNVPAELQNLLDSCDGTRGIFLESGEPERVTDFDTCGGEGRNADLVLWGRGPKGDAVISVEAKADEPFGEIAGEYVRGASARNPRSRVPERFGFLCRGVLGIDSSHPQACALRYQLLTAVAGALAEARLYGAETVVVIIHEFVGATDPSKVSANAADLNRFVVGLSGGRTQAIRPGEMAGPFTVPGNEHFAGTRGLFLGKCRRDVQSA